MSVKIPGEFNSFTARHEDNEFEVEVVARTDRVVTSCDLLVFAIPNVGTFTLVIDADFRHDQPELAGPLQALFDAVKEVD